MIYGLPSSAYEKSIVRNLVLNSDKFFPCTQTAGKRFHSGITRTEMGRKREQKNAMNDTVDIFWLPQTPTSRNHCGGDLPFPSLLSRPLIPLLSLSFISLFRFSSHPSIPFLPLPPVSTFPLSSLLPFFSPLNPAKLPCVKVDAKIG